MALSTPRLRRSRKMTHLCSPKMTHPGARIGSRTLRFCGGGEVPRAKEKWPCQKLSVDQFKRAQVGHFSRALRPRSVLTVFRGKGPTGLGGVGEHQQPRAQDLAPRSQLGPRRPGDHGVHPVEKLQRGGQLAAHRRPLVGNRRRARRRLPER